VSLISFMLDALRFTPTQRLPCIIAYSIVMIPVSFV
jgi:hypothetical protein